VADVEVQVGAGPEIMTPKVTREPRLPTTSWLPTLFTPKDVDPDSVAPSLQAQVKLATN
jgi:hypothetical protein